MCLFYLKGAIGSRYVATVKTIRQVKTVFIIFIVFVCCWSPYVIVLLYDSSDTLPLPVHLYTSMLAHLHANLNFAIYSLGDHTFRAAHCRRLVTHVADYCFRRSTTTNAAAAAAAATTDAVAYGSLEAYRARGITAGRITGGGRVNSTVAVECHHCT